MLFAWAVCRFGQEAVLLGPHMSDQLYIGYVSQNGQGVEENRRANWAGGSYAERIRIIGVVVVMMSIC